MKPIDPIPVLNFLDFMAILETPTLTPSQAASRIRELQIIKGLVKSLAEPERVTLRQVERAS